MFEFLKRKKAPVPTPENTPVIENPVAQLPASNENTPGFFARLRTGLAKTRASFSQGMATILFGQKELDQSVIDEIETLLLTADVGIETTSFLIKSLTQKLARKELADTEAAFRSLQDAMLAILKPCVKPLVLKRNPDKPQVILMIGINGSGKTTTIGKLAHYFKAQTFNVMLAAGDTFRAAAIEQLQEWGKRNAVPVIAQQTGADTAAVIYDALEAAQARKMDILLADTAGRLHTQTNLMGELQKIARVVTKLDPEAPHETLIVLDATLGQNALAQVKEFHAAIKIDGIVLTKLDGTAKGGIIFAIAKETGIPIRFIGIGEGITDLRPFEPEEFVAALFA